MLSVKESFGSIKTVGLSKTSSMVTTQLRGLTERGFAYKELEYSTLLQQNRLLSYEVYVWTFACIRAIASQLVKLPFNIYQMNQDGSANKDAKITSGREWNLFRRPNAMQNYNSFMYSVVSGSQLMGNVYLEKGGVDPDNPTELYFLRGDWVEIIPDPIKLVAQYLYRPNGVPIYLEPNEVAHFKLWHPRSELYGLSPLSAIRSTITTDMFIQQWQQNFFRQGGVANHYISCPTELSDEDFERLKRESRNEMSGVDRSHMLGVLDNDMKIETVDDESNKLDLTALRLQLRNEVCGAFHVPLIWVMAEQQTYNNADAQKKIGFENCIQPLAKQLEAFFDSEFLNASGLCCEFDFSGVHSLQDNEKEKAETARTYVQAGIMTPNEAREKYLHMKPIAGGEQLIITGKVETVDNVDAGIAPTAGGLDKAEGIANIEPAPQVNPANPFNAGLNDGLTVMRKMRKAAHLAKHNKAMRIGKENHKKAIAPALESFKKNVMKVIETHAVLE